MNAISVALSRSSRITVLVGLALLNACTEQHTPKVPNIVVGSNVTLNSHALTCEKPSDELNQVANSSGAAQSDIVAKVARREECHDSGEFLANGQWRVLAVNDKQLRIKMRGYLGEYWVSRAQVSLSETSTKADAGGKKIASDIGPVTIDEWRKSFSSAFEQSDTEKKSDDGITTFFASFHKKAFARGKYDAFSKMYLFTSPTTEFAEFLGTGVYCYVLVAEGRPPVVALSPVYVNRDGGANLEMRKLAILVDGELLFERAFQASDIKQKPFGVHTGESANVVLSEREINALRKITKDSHVAIRLTGKTEYVSLKKERGIDPVDMSKKSIIESLAIYDSIKNATAGHMPDQPSNEM